MCHSSDVSMIVFRSLVTGCVIIRPGTVSETMGCVQQQQYHWSRVVMRNNFSDVLQTIVRLHQSVINITNTDMIQLNETLVTDDLIDDIMIETDDTALFVAMEVGEAGSSSSGEAVSGVATDKCS